MFCLAPLIMTGYLLTVQTSWHHTESVNAPYIEAQTCQTGLGAHVKAATSGLYAAGVHYGFTHDFTDKLNVTLQPKAGFSYVDHPMRELPLRTQFELGLGFIVSRDRFSVGLEYWHLSDAGLRSPNIGLDMVGTTIGWRF